VVGFFLLQLLLGRVAMLKIGF